VHSLSRLSCIVFCLGDRLLDLRGEFLERAFHRLVERLELLADHPRRDGEVDVLPAALRRGDHAEDLAAGLRQDRAAARTGRNRRGDLDQVRLSRVRAQAADDPLRKRIAIAQRTADGHDGSAHAHGPPARRA